MNENKQTWLYLLHVYTTNIIMFSRKSYNFILKKPYRIVLVVYNYRIQIIHIRNSFTIRGQIY